MMNSICVRQYISTIAICLTAISIPFTTIHAETLNPVSGRNLDINSILPADVLARVTLLSDDIGLIRRELGKPEINSALETVIDTSPREVYFQAKTSLVKANRLLFEVVGLRGDSPLEVEIKAIQPFHVWQTINTSYEQIQLIKQSLNIYEQSIEKEQAINTSPSDVFANVVLTNKQLNALLTQQFSSNDLYQKINESIHVMAAVLATTPSVKRIPAEAEFVRWKTPEDIYVYLVESRDILLNIMGNYDLKFAHFNTATATATATDSSDVYDFASLLVANLHYVHSLKLTAKPPSKTYMVDHKIPSDVYQRVSILHQQLQMLEQLHENDPHWLNK